LGRTDESSSIAVTLGGLGYENAGSFTFLPGGNFLLGGSTIKSIGETTDFFLSEIDSSGTVKWFRVYGGPHLDYLGSITKSKEGGFLLWGETRSLFFTPLPGFDPDLKSLLVKVDNAGVAEWSEEIRSVPSDMIQAKDGKYILAGVAYIHGNADLSLVKIDPTGKHIWQWTYRVPELNSNEGAISVVELSKGGYLVLGSTSGSDKRWILGSPLLLHLGADGELQRSLRLDGIKGRMSRMIRFQDGFVILGRIGEEDEILVIRTDAEGNILWANSYGGQYEDKAFSINEDSKELLLIGGATKSFGKGDWDGVLLGVTKKGETAYCLTIGSSELDLIRSVKEAENDQLFVLGETAGIGPGMRDIFFTSGRRDEGGLWQSCAKDIKAKPITIQPSKIQLIGDKGGIEVRRVPTEFQGRSSGIGLRESGFPVLSEGQ